MAKCKDCAHFLTCRQGNSNPDYCGQFMRYENTVEVVRCKDCKHWKAIGVLEQHWECQIFCGLHDNGYLTGADDFCSYGERKDNDTSNLR